MIEDGELTEVAANDHFIECNPADKAVANKSFDAFI